LFYSHSFFIPFAFKFLNNYLIIIFHFLLIIFAILQKSFFKNEFIQDEILPIQYFYWFLTFVTYLAQLKNYFDYLLLFNPTLKLLSFISIK